MTYNMDDYVDVADRIKSFYDKHPEGSLRRAHDPRVMKVGDKTFVLYTALAYRSPTDEHPAMGTAWEPVPGPTPFTLDSEVMNAETSAWGRAIIAVGIPAKKGIASRQEVEARQGNGKAQTAGATEEQLREIERLARGLGASDPNQATLWAYYAAHSPAKASGAIQALRGEVEGTAAKDALTTAVTLAGEWAAKQPDVPADMEGLEV